MKQKTVIIYGAGLSGCGAAVILAERKYKVFLYNDNQCEVNQDLLDVITVNGGGLVIGTDALKKIDVQIDLAVLSPGIPCDSENVLYMEHKGIEVISEVELGYRLYNGHIAAITGTNGKTTTTTIVGEMLKKLPVSSSVGGNIGVSFSQEVEHLSEDSWIAAELSSFQLEKVTTFCPDIAVVLNLTPDHLERHHTMEAYANAKKNIFLRQGKEQITVLNYDDIQVRQWANESNGQICYFSRKKKLEQGIFIDNGNFIIKWNGQEQRVCNIKEMHLFGGHNEENIMAAIACGYFAGVSVKDMADVLRNFQGIEHRIEYVATIDGVKYYNDSKATNTDSTIKALEAFVDGHIILLAGGHDKMTELEPMMSLVSKKTDLLILLGEARERFYQAAITCGVKNIVLADSFEDAVRKAYNMAKEPQIVLLSPACSSYDMFKNYPERGRRFKELVKSLTI